MNDNEILKERLDRAEKAMEKAQEKLERAEEALTEDWKKKNPNGSNAELLKYLKVELQEYSTVVESCRKTYDNLVETHKELVKKMPNANSATLEDNIIKCMKRVLDDAESSSASKRTNPNRPGQKAFVKRLVQRDGKCPIMNTPSDGCEGAHIIGYSYWKENMDIWDRSYKEFCHDYKHNVDDVRNGILMDRRLHYYFDRHFFTIYRNNNIFTLKVGEHLYPDDAQFANLDNHVLSFGTEQCLWPHAKFLEFHNMRFTFKQMKAAAEPKQFDRQNTDETITHNFDSLDTLKAKWITEQKDMKQYDYCTEDLCDPIKLGE